MIWVRYKSSVKLVHLLPTCGRVLRSAGALALIAGLTAALPAMAAPKPASGGQAGNLHLLASGPATVNAQGKVVAWGVLPTPGRFQVTGKPGTFTVRIDGVLQKASRRGVLRLDGVAGHFAIQGARGVKVRIDGTDVDVSIAGRGSALPVGTGTYSLNGAPYMPWTGQPIPIAPASKLQPPVKPPPSLPGNTPGDR